MPIGAPVGQLELHEPHVQRLWPCAACHVFKVLTSLDQTIFLATQVTT